MREEQEKGRLKACQGEKEVRLEGKAFSFFFFKSSDVRLAGCPQRTAEKSI